MLLIYVSCLIWYFYTVIICIFKYFVKAERYSKRSACLYVTSPSTAILMVLSRLSCDLVKLGYFAFGLTVHSCSGNSCSGR